MTEATESTSVIGVRYATSSNSFLKFYYKFFPQIERENKSSRYSARVMLVFGKKKYRDKTSISAFDAGPEMEVTFRNRQLLLAVKVSPMRRQR